jgi:hypothetical protein
MPVPDQVRDDGSGIQKPSNLLDSGLRRNEGKAGELTFYEVINQRIDTKKLGRALRCRLSM